MSSAESSSESADRLPEQIAPSRLFSRQARVKGSIAVAKLERLSAFLSSSAGTVEADLLFTLEEGHRVIQGKLNAEVFVVCQRCLEEMPQRIESSMALKLDVEAEPELAELIETGEDSLDLLSLVEDELILSLPIVPRHENSDCSVQLNALRTASTPASGAEQGRHQPFAVLEALKSSMGSKQKN